MKYVFAGDRQISVNILKWIIDRGYCPSALIISAGKNESHSAELIKISNLPVDRIFVGKSFYEPASIVTLNSLDADYFIGIHFSYIIPSSVLNIPKIGFLNLHPAHLPYNKGWHTPSWALLDGTPYGATLHFMSEVLDEGDIIHQKKIEVKPDDTANSLYKKVLTLEEEVFQEAFDDLLSLNPKRQKQNFEGTSYIKGDLIKVQEINLFDSYKAEELINILRALTTNDINESAYFIKDGKKISIQINLLTKDD
jgi:methionyl-tRNA formyltransferase